MLEDLAQGMIRYNNYDERVELYDGSKLTSVAGSPMVLTLTSKRISNWNGIDSRIENGSTSKNKVIKSIGTICYCLEINQ